MMVAAPTPEIVARAAHWAALLDDEPVSQRLLDACERWCGEDPRHRVALERMRGLTRRFDGLGGVEREALGLALSRRQRPGRRSGLAALALLLLLAGAGWGTIAPLLAPLLPDQRTGGERRALALADGSELTLDADSALDIDLASSSRRVTLYRGQILARVAPDTSRPFTVVTADGTATALGTGFIVRREAAGTRVTIIESRVRVCAGRPEAGCLELGPGQRALVTATAVTALPDIDPHAAVAWTRGWLEADDMPLTELLAELNRHRPRPIRFDPALLAGRRVTGSFPLDDTDRAARALAALAGLRLERAAGGDLVLLPAR